MINEAGGLQGLHEPEPDPAAVRLHAQTAGQLEVVGVLPDAKCHSEERDITSVYNR